MAKIRKIYDEAVKPDGSKQVIYPITSTRAVYTTTNVTVDSLINEGYRFGGVVGVSDTPTVVTGQRAFYAATEPGRYGAFGSLVVEPDEIAFLLFNGSEWSKQLYIKAISTEKIADEAITTPKLANQAVTTDKIKDSNVSWGKLDDNVKNLIATGGGQHGTPFAIEFGDSDEIGITQRVLTESRDSLQSQINEIVASDTTLSLTANPSAIFVDEDTTVTLNASLTSSIISTASKVIIKKSGTSDNIASANNVASLSGTTVEHPTEPSTITYNGVFTISGNNRTVSRNISAVYPIYYGAGATYTDIDDNEHKASARTSPAGTYNITNSENGQYLFWVVPATMTINSASMGGFEFPITLAETVTIDEVSYKVYRSTETQDAGSFTIIIS